MKKKHLHGKLSLKMKDLSAMNGQAKQAQGGGATDEAGCISNTVPCPTAYGHDSCEGGVCTVVNSQQICDTRVSCPGDTSCLYCAPTTPPRGCDTHADCVPESANCPSNIICTA